MSRAVRIEFDGARYHVMSRGVARMPTFLDDDDRMHFLDVVGDLVEQGVLVVYALCLMPNHFHLLLSTPASGLARWMRHVNGDYALWFNSRHRRVGHVWQGRYKAIVVEGGRYLAECSRYIHLNPNRARITRPAERYRWSSYRNYVGGPRAVPWVETRPVLEELGVDGRGYRDYVESGRGEELVNPFERATARLVLGSEAFADRIREMLKGRPDPGDQPSLREIRRAGMATPAEVEGAVDTVFPGAKPARRRRLLLYALRRYSSLRTMEIARLYGRTHGAVFLAVRDLETEARETPAFAARLRTLAKRLKITSV